MGPPSSLLFWLFLYLCSAPQSARASRAPQADLHDGPDVAHRVLPDAVAATAQLPGLPFCAGVRLGNRPSWTQRAHLW
eukprot:9378814-Alexandrium_andersonii.AAC.1